MQFNVNFLHEDNDLQEPPSFKGELFAMIYTLHYLN
jgi:hypothetical protein